MMNYEALASEILRVQRGRRSQTGHSRWLGFKSNVAYAWESGKYFPSAAQALQIWERRGIDLREAYRRFYQRDPAWLNTVAPASPEGVSALLLDLKGRTSILDLARAVGKSRFVVARWLSADTEIRLPDFLSLIETMSFRVLDYLAQLVDPKKLPSAAPAWIRLEGARSAAYNMPWTQAVLRALELDDYAKLKAHDSAWIARQLGIELSVVESALTLLRDSGQIVAQDRKFAPVDTLALDTRRDPNLAWRARRFWARVALERLEARSEGNYSYNVFGISEADLAKVAALQASYFRELRSIVAQSAPVQRIVLMNYQLLPLDGGASDTITTP